MTSSSSLEHLVRPVVDHLLPLLDESLSACAERHRIADGQGVDNFSFGTDAWSLPARKFKDAVEEESIPFSVARAPGCVLAFGDDRIRHHRVGWTEVDRIEVSFPGNAKALAGELEQAEQLSFEFPDDNPPSVDAIVLAYMANPSVGLCAAYLARVGRVEHGRIVEWAETRELYRRDVPADAGEVVHSVPAETVPTPTVRRTRKKERDEDEG